MLELGYKVSAAWSCPRGMHLLLLFHFAFFSVPSLKKKKKKSTWTFTLLSSVGGAFLFFPEPELSSVRRAVVPPCSRKCLCLMCRNQRGKKESECGGSFAKHGWEALIEPLESRELLMSQHIHWSMTSEGNPNRFFFLKNIIIATPPPHASETLFLHLIWQRLSKNLTQVLSFIRLNCWSN